MAASKLGVSSRSLRFVSRLRDASVGCAAITGALSVLVFVGWMLHVEVLKRLLPGLPQMKANTAVCFLLASVALVGYSRSVPGSGVRRAAAGCAVVVVVVGAVTLAEYTFGVRLGIDVLLFRDRVGRYAPYPGRLAANTALGFVLVGGALLLWEVRLGRWWPSNVLAWLAAAVGLLALIGYPSGAGSLIDLTAHQRIALNSAAALTILSLGFPIEVSRAVWGRGRRASCGGVDP